MHLKCSEKVAEFVGLRLAECHCEKETTVIKKRWNACGLAMTFLPRTASTTDWNLNSTGEEVAYGTKWKSFFHEHDGAVCVFS